MTDAIAPEALSDLIAKIYDCAVEATRWPDALEAIRLALNCQNATFSLQLLPEGKVLVNITRNIPEPYLTKMADYSRDVIDQWGGAAAIQALPFDQPAALSRVNPAAVDFAVTRNRYSLEWAMPQGLVDVMAIGLARDAHALGTVAFGRHSRHGLINDSDLLLAKLLLPHLQRAVSINRLLELAYDSYSAAINVLDMLTVPVIVLNENLDVLHINPPGIPIVAREDPIYIRKNRLGAANPVIARAMALAISQNSDLACWDKKGIAIPFRRMGGTIGALHVAPLRGTHPDAVVGGLTTSKNGAVAVFVCEGAVSALPPAELVISLFCFTPAEARIFLLAAEGKSVPEMAFHLKVAHSTVKTHLIRLFEKAGVRRQADLIQIAIALALPVASWENAMTMGAV